MAEYFNNDSLMLTGRTKPNSSVKFFFSNEFIKDSQSDNYGVWKLELKNFELTDRNLMITTEIQGQKLKLKTKIK